MRSRALTTALVIALTGVTLGACGGGGGDRSYSPPPDSSLTRLFNLSPDVALAENLRTVDYDFDVTGLNAAQLAYSIAGGADADLFTIAQDGTLSFTFIPDFEDPADAGANNVYNVSVQAADASAYGRWNFAIRIEQDLRDGYQLTRMTTGLEFPVFLTSVPDGSGKLLIVEKNGQIEVFDPQTGTLSAQKFLDVTSQLSTSSEQGLLGLALAPDFETSGIFYVAMTALDTDSELRRYRVDADNPLVADTTTMEVLLTIEQNLPQHNGNWLGFGPDGYLYWAVGDGGGVGDPERNGIDPFTLKAAMLRLDVSGDDFPDDTTRNYAIPADNPFVQGGGAPEIYAWGMRNPWRASFDPETGYLYFGDVGQDAREEVNLIRPEDAGGYYGWNRQEGTIPFRGGADDPSFIDPVAEYIQDQPNPPGTAVTGGYVYRGRANPLRGKYIFGDFVTGNVWALPVEDIEQGKTIAYEQFEILTDDFSPDSGDINNIVSFGVDEFDNLYIMDYGDGDIFMVEPQ